MNVGSMKGKGRELADWMERKRVEVICGRELGGGFKLIYSGTSERGRNGVGTVLSGEMKESVVSVSRRSDRVMSPRLFIEGLTVNIVSAYAP